MTENVRFAIVACPLYFIHEHSVHVWNDFYRHIHKAFTEDKAKVRRGIVGKDSAECVV
jgi:hypothetical protein